VKHAVLSAAADTSAPVCTVLLLRRYTGRTGHYRWLDQYPHLCSHIATIKKGALPLLRYEEGKLCDYAVVDYALQILVVWNDAARRLVETNIATSAVSMDDWEREMHAAARDIVGDAAWGSECMYFQPNWLSAGQQPL
jgi:hypothetical protein